MARFRIALRRFTAWLERRFGPVVPVPLGLDDFRIEDGDVTADLAYGRD